MKAYTEFKQSHSGVLSKDEKTFILPYYGYAAYIRSVDTSVLTDKTDIRVCELADKKIYTHSQESINSLKNEISELSNLHKFGVLHRMLHSNKDDTGVFVTETYKNFITWFLDNDTEIAKIMYLYLKSLDIFKISEHEKEFDYTL